jgi:hypothetical protein
VRSARAILSLKYTPVGAGAGRAVAGFLRYVQYRDHHEAPERAAGVEGLVRYVAYRDAASPQGRLFDEAITVGDQERKRMGAYVRRSIGDARSRSGVPARAVYRLVISPEDARGLDLRAITRSTMEQLGRDVGGLPPWIAAEHRNTAHPHVHIVLPAWREVAPGRFRQLVITKPRLAAMKAAMTREIERERGVRTKEPEREQARSPSVTTSFHRGPRRRRHTLVRTRGVAYELTRILRTAERAYQEQAERDAEMARERDRGWER